MEGSAAAASAAATGHRHCKLPRLLGSYGGGASGASGGGGGGSDSKPDNVAQQQQQQQHAARQDEDDPEHDIIYVTSSSSSSDDEEQLDSTAHPRAEIQVVMQSMEPVDQRPSDSHLQQDREIFVLAVGTMASVPQGEYTCCPIAMEEFDKASVDYFPEDVCFVEGKPEYCVGRLPCGHRFHALSILYHLVVNGMTCPVCRCVCLCLSVLYKCGRKIKLLGMSNP